MDSRKRILIVEDDSLIAEDIKLKVESLGYSVIGVTGSGTESVELTDRDGPDLVLMDIVLPGEMDGIAAADQIRRRTGIPVVFLTAYSNRDFLERAKITDPLAYVLKPYSERELYSVLTLAFYKAKLQRELEQRALLGATLMSLSEALLVWDGAGKVTRVNDACMKLLHCDEAELVGKPVLDVLQFRDCASGDSLTEETFYSLEKEGILYDERDVLLIRKDASTCPVRLSGSRIRNEGTDYSAFVILIRDDSDRRRNENALKESEERFQELANHIDSVFFLSDLDDGRVIYVNPAVERICGVPRTIVMGNDLCFGNNVVASDRDKVAAMLSTVRSGSPCEENFQIVLADSSRRRLNARCYPVRDPETGRANRMACVVEDITERTRAESKLRQAAAVFDNTAEGILITDTDLIVTAVNKAFSEITGFSEEEIVGKTPSLLKSGMHDDAFFQQMWNSLNETGEWRGEIWNRRKNGEIYPAWMTISAIRDGQGRITHYVSTGSDITSLKKAQEKLDYLAHHDHLTGFANRLLFNARLSHAVERAHRVKGKIAILLMDLDRFKEVNDSLGHSTGDTLLQMVARRLGGCVRQEDTLARLGGDEFALILEDVKDALGIMSVAEKILSGFSLPFSLENREIIITVSIGISVYPDDGIDVTTLIRHADMAMYRAKDQGRNKYCFYTEDLTAESFARFTLENQMRQALAREEFELYFQPQLSLADDKIVGAEALIRWRHPEMGMVPPNRFIPLAEETGFIEALGEWVLLKACSQCREWHAKGLSGLIIAVNLSPRQVMYGEIADTVKSILKESGLPAKYLELEITETSIMHQADRAMETLTRLKALGVKIAIDDFGTGYSSLSYLKRFPVDKLKIDHSFILDIPHDSQDVAISKAILALGRSLELTVIAEGVETEAQKAFLVRETCDEMQGYLLSKPLPADAFFDLAMDRWG